MKKCNECLTEKQENQFPQPRPGYRGNKCHSCVKKKERQSTRYKEQAEVRSRRAKDRRADHSNVHKYILWDSRSSDKKKGLENDLDSEYVQNTIRDGCTYCGETSLRMTLDRIDNCIGHTKVNVVGACIRCNMLRGSIPHAAWTAMVPGVKLAAQQGLFGEWGKSPLRK